MSYLSLLIKSLKLTSFCEPVLGLLESFSWEYPFRPFTGVGIRDAGWLRERRATLEKRSVGTALVDVDAIKREDATVGALWSDSSGGRTPVVRLRLLRFGCVLDFRIGDPRLVVEVYDDAQ